MPGSIPHRHAGSPFYTLPPPVGDPVPEAKEPQKTFPAMQDKLNVGPTEAELEAWYTTLNDLSRLFDNTPHGDDLADIRDSIYKHLR